MSLVIEGNPMPTIRPEFTIGALNATLGLWSDDQMQPHVRAEIQRCVQEIRKICPEARVFVFGSSIDKSVENPKDIDLLVSIPDAEPFKPLRRRILAIPRASWPLDIIVVPSEFLEEKICKSGNFYSFAVSEGIEVGQEQKVTA